MQSFTEKAPSRRSRRLARKVRNVATPCIIHRIDAVRAHDEAGSVDLGGGLCDLDLGRLQVAEFGTIVGRGPMPREFDVVIQTGLRITQADTRQHVRKQREYRQRIQRVWVDHASRRRSAGQFADRDGHFLRNKAILDPYVVRSGAAQSRRIPGVVDPVLAPVEQEYAVFDAVSLIVR